MLAKRFWIPVLIVLLAVVGIGLFYGQHIAKQSVTDQEPIKIYKAVEVEKPAAAPKPPPPGETHETGHWHGDVWHAVPHAPLPEQTIGEHKAPANWNELPPEERRKLFGDAYRAKWGDDPSWDGKYRHIYDDHGRVRRHYRNRPLMTHYETRIWFAPPPDVLQRYLKLQEAYQSAKDAGNHLKSDAISQEMQAIVLRHQGEVPVRPYAYAYYGDAILPEEEKQLEAEATREVYELMGIGHLYEFYESIFFNNP